MLLNYFGDGRKTMQSVVRVAAVVCLFFVSKPIAFAQDSELSNKLKQFVVEIQSDTFDVCAAVSSNSISRQDLFSVDDDDKDFASIYYSALTGCTQSSFHIEPIDVAKDECHAPKQMSFIYGLAVGHLVKFFQKNSNVSLFVHCVEMSFINSGYLPYGAGGSNFRSIAILRSKIGELNLFQASLAGHLRIEFSEFESVSVQSANIRYDLIFFNSKAASFQVLNSTIGNSVIIGASTFGVLADNGLGDGFFKINNVDVGRNLFVGYEGDNDNLGLVAHAENNVVVNGHFYVADLSVKHNLMFSSLILSGTQGRPRLGEASNSGIYTIRNVKIAFSPSIQQDGRFVGIGLNRSSLAIIRGLQLDGSLAASQLDAAVIDLSNTQIDGDADFSLLRSTRLEAYAVTAKNMSFANCEIGTFQLGYLVTGRVYSWSHFEALNFDRCRIQDVLIGRVNLDQISARGSNFNNFEIRWVTISKFVDFAGSEFKNALALGGIDKDGPLGGPGKDGQRVGPVWFPSSYLSLSGVKAGTIYAGRQDLSLEMGQKEPVPTNLRGAEYNLMAAPDEFKQVRSLGAFSSSFADAPTSMHLDWLRSGMLVRFDPHPYTVFAKALQRSGHNGKAADVLVDRVARANWEEGTISGKIKFLFGWPISWGYKNENALLIAVIFVLIGSLVSSYYQNYPVVFAPPDEKTRYKRDKETLKASLESGRMGATKLVWTFASRILLPMLLPALAIVLLLSSVPDPDVALWATGSVVSCVAILMLSRHWRSISNSLREHNQKIYRAIVTVGAHDFYFSMDRFFPAPGFHSYWGNYPKIGQAGRNYFYFHRMIGALVTGIAIAGITGLFD